jgi:ferredoxin
MAATLVITDMFGNKKIITANGDEHKSIIDLGDDNDIELPYSCRSGACFACSWSVKAWWAYLNPEKTGDQLIDTDEGEVLCCIAWLTPEAISDNATIEIEMLNG